MQRRDQQPMAVVVGLDLPWQRRREAGDALAAGIGRDRQVHLRAAAAAGPGERRVVGNAKALASGDREVLRSRLRNDLRRWEPARAEKDGGDAAGDGKSGAHRGKDAPFFAPEELKCARSGGPGWWRSRGAGRGGRF
jgi:hypothetical protein